MGNRNVCEEKDFAEHDDRQTDPAGQGNSSPALSPSTKAGMTDSLLLFDPAKYHVTRGIDCW